MNKFLGMLAVVALVASPAWANLDVKAGDVIRFYDREGTINGGEFGVALAGSPDKPELFRTFCIEKTEYLDFNYNGFNVVSVTDRAIHGSVPNGSDPISAQTAYLYSQFRAGTLSNYVYAAGGAAGGTWDRVDSANELQEAIWYLEGEVGSVNGQAATWVTEANTKVNSGQWIGLGNVRVANLTWATARSGFAANSVAQDVLVIVPAPGAALLVVLGLGLVGWVKKRLA